LLQRPAPKSFAAEVSKEAQLRFLQLRHEMLLDNTELENLWFILRQYAAADDDEQVRVRDGNGSVCRAGSTNMRRGRWRCLPALYLEQPSIFHPR
jgi:hypothetical protein